MKPAVNLIPELIEADEKAIREVFIEYEDNRRLIRSDVLMNLEMTVV